MASDRTRHLVHYNEYVAGWLDSSILDFLALLPRQSDSAAYALITCLDSDLEPASLLAKHPEIRLAPNEAKPLKKGLLVPFKALHKASLRQQLFVGFDEIWFFPHDEVTPKPDSAWIVGPNRIDQAKLDELGPWMSENGCSLALGDGDGLNFIVKAHGLVKYLLAQSMFQPGPTYQMNETWVQDEA